jgi:hypothetical protein
MDFFCPTNGGIRVGYASPALLRGLSSHQRRQLRGRVVLILTANAHFTIHGIRSGSRLTVARRRLHLTMFHVGRNYWYLAPDGPSRAVLKVRGGRVQEVGIANRNLTGLRRPASRFLRSFS